MLTQTIGKSVLTSIDQRLEENNDGILNEEKGLLVLKMDNPEMLNPRKGDQFHHNSEVLRMIEKAANCIVKGDGEASIAALNGGKRLIWER